MRQSRRRQTVAILVGIATISVSGGVAAQAAAGSPALLQASGPLLLDEDFTGESAIPQFTGYGTACLTGAPQVVGLGAAEHPLTGCPAQGTPPAAFAGLFPVSPPLDSAPYGFLRLTDALPDQAGAVLYDTPIQATDGVEITFEQWQYGGYSTMPQFAGQTADGISFFLVDATAELDAPGAFGGSLGYAKKLPDDNPANALVPGVAGGYLGFGFDVLGNFYGDWEQRGAGCSGDGLSPAGSGFLVPAPGQNMVTVRGPMGADRTVGYCFLDATATGPGASTLPGLLHGAAVGPLSTVPATASASLEPSKRTVTMVLEPEPVHTITVFIDFHDGNGSQQVLSTVAPEPVPAAVKFGFAASTGAFTDVHLIRTLRMQAVDPSPRLDLLKSELPNTASRVGDTIDYRFHVTNSGGGEITGIVIDDPRLGPVSCPQTTLAEGEAMDCSGRYSITQADLDSGEIVNSARARGVGRGGPISSDPSTTEHDLPTLANGGVDGDLVAGLLAAAALLLTGGAVVLSRRRTARAE